VGEGVWLVGDACALFMGGRGEWRWFPPDGLIVVVDDELVLLAGGEGAHGQQELWGGGGGVGLRGCGGWFQAGSCMQVEGGGRW